MDQYLSQLVDRMPPPEDVQNTTIDWMVAESALGFSYPSSFKEFIGQYGDCRWFDHFFPVYPDTTSDKELQEFIDRLSNSLPRELGRKLRDVDREPVECSLFPEPGGLFLFMRDYSGGVCCWDTSEPDPSSWPVQYCIGGFLFSLGSMTIAQMFLYWLDGKEPMLDRWGDVNDLEPSQRTVIPFGREE